MEYSGQYESQIEMQKRLRLVMPGVLLVIFAGTLIIVMLLRPQGILAHHEFSWTWLKGLFRREPAQEATA